MGRKADMGGAAIVEALARDPEARLVAEADGSFRLAGGGARGGVMSAATFRGYRAAGLLAEISPGAFAATPAAAAWLKRRADSERPFRAQHGTLAEKRPAEGGKVVVDLDESPVAALARRVGKGGEPWLLPHMVEAAERLRRDFEVGQLQPRVTANWSASVSTGRRAGDGGGLADLTDMALAARLRFGRAMRSVGPELSGALVDVCCFLKGLETLEHERLWPARSAKLVLRLALEALARHYGLTPTATGKAGAKLRHWGAEDYRPDLS